MMWIGRWGNALAGLRGESRILGREIFIRNFRDGGHIARVVVLRRVKFGIFLVKFGV